MYARGNYNRDFLSEFGKLFVVYEFFNASIYYTNKFTIHIQSIHNPNPQIHFWPQMLAFRISFNLRKYFVFPVPSNTK